MKALRALVLSCLVAAGIRLAAQTYTFSTAASLYGAGGVVIDAAGNFYVSTFNSHTILRFSPSGASTLIAGLSYSPGSADGSGNTARFVNPRGVALDAAGNLYVADSMNHTLRKITPTGVVTTLAGLAGTRGSADGTGTAARFDYPQGVAVDAGGNLYVADTNNHTIRKITPAGVVTTLAGLAATADAVDGAGSAARFAYPHGTAVDAAGNVYVVDTNNHAIRKITPAGVVTTLAGFAGNRGSADGTGKGARFDLPQALAIDTGGTVFVADTNNHTIRKVTAAGVVTTIGGLAGSYGETNGTGGSARIGTGRGIAVDATGTLYIADSNSIRLGTPSSQPAITVQPQTQSVAAGASIALSVTATGATPFTYQWQKDGATIAGATLATLAFPNVQAGDSATYTVSASNSLGTVASSGAVLTVLAPLPNNDFARAQELTASGSSVSGTNVGATGEVNEPTHFQPSGTASSVWYKWTPAQSGRTTFSTQNSSFSTALAIYTGASLESLQRVAQNPSSVSFRSVAGTTYYIAVGSYGLQRGNFNLSWQTIPNDDFAAAQDLAGSSGSVTGNNAGATGEAGEPIHWSASGTSTSIWYRWTPSQSGTAVVDTIGSSVDTVLAAYSGSSLATLTRLAQDNDGASQPGSYGASRIAFVVSAGSTYYLAAGTSSYGTGRISINYTLTTAPVITAQPVASITLSTGANSNLSVSAASFLPVTYQWQRNGVAIPGATNSSLALNNVQTADAGTYVAVISSSGGIATSTTTVVNVLVPPSNDNFANARDVIGTSGTVAGSNVNATGESGEPVHWNLSGTNSSIWYRWTAPGNGLAVIDTVGSVFDTVLAVYTGTSLTALSRLTQDDDRAGGRTSQVSFAASNGTTYYIAVGGNHSGARGALTLNWQLSLAVAIATQPVSQTVAAGGSATFTVAATGAGIAYQWSRNGVAIPGATNATLALGSIQLGDDASYTVTVTSSSGTVTSAPATLAVAAPTATTLSVRRVREGANLLWSIAAGAGEIVTVGSLGVILSSSDNGVTWVPRESGSTGWLVAVTYGGGQFVIVGESGLILTSPDGRTWTRANASGTSERLNNVLFADGKYVAVGEKGVVVTSTDGRVWTPRSTPVTTWLHGLAYHAGIRHFAACGEAGVFLYSPDAVTWSRLPVPGYTRALQHTVAVDSYANFVAVGELGMVVSVRRNELVLKDGQPLVTWTAEPNPTSTTAHLIGLVQGAGALFAAGEDGKVITATSDRGPWTTVSSGTSDLLLAGMFHNDTLYVVGSREVVLQSERLYGSRLINISTRGQVGTGGDLMISGFVVTGDRPKQMLIRAAGPTLASSFGLTGVLAAPVLTLIDGAGRTLATNTGWGNNANAATIAATTARVGAFPLASGSADSALLMTLAPGAYTAQISGANNSTGLSIVEVYDSDVLSNEGPRAINISTRGLVGTGANQMIAGFVIEGASSRRVLIRASGPALAGFGVAGTLAEPKIELYNSRNLLHTTAGAWGLQANADEIRGAAKTVSAFDLPDGSRDSAMVVTLLPGSWTVQVSGVNNTTGVALVEVYVLP